MKLSVETKDVEELKTYSKILNDTKTNFYTCHCTGVEQFDFLKNYMTNKLNYLSSGSFVEV
jgi:7,8-dihydropterin-6-yl-methyl-4-(beta-D-ribofuranosyl)aminobenzene 5'-phosphate synthase